MVRLGKRSRRKVIERNMLASHTFLIRLQQIVDYYQIQVKSSLWNRKLFHFEDSKEFKWKTKHSWANYVLRTADETWMKMNNAVDVSLMHSSATAIIYKMRWLICSYVDHLYLHLHTIYRIRKDTHGRRRSKQTTIKDDERREENNGRCAEPTMIQEDWPTMSTTQFEWDKIWVERHHRLKKPSDFFTKEEQSMPNIRSKNKSLTVSDNCFA